MDGWIDGCPCCCQQIRVWAVGSRIPAQSGRRYNCLRIFKKWLMPGGCDLTDLGRVLEIRMFLNSSPQVILICNQSFKKYHWFRLWLKLYQIASLWAKLCTKEAPCHFPKRLTALMIIVTVCLKQQTIVYKTIAGMYVLGTPTMPPNSMVTDEFIASQGTPSTAWLIFLLEHKFFPLFTHTQIQSLLLSHHS